MSSRSGTPLASTGTGTITAPARGVGASASPPSLHGTSSGAACIRRASTGRCQMPWRPGRLPAAGASKRIAPGRARAAPRSWTNTAPRAGCARGSPPVAARRAFSAQASSIAAYVRSSGGRCVAAISTRAPARRSDAASSASASRRPAVPPRDTIRTSARAIGLAFWRGHEHARRDLLRLPPPAHGPRALVGARAARGLVSITRTPDELSIVCAEEAVPPDTRSRRAGRLQVPGPIPFSETGVLARSRRRWRPPASRSSPSPPTTRTTCSSGPNLDDALAALKSTGRRLITSGSPYEPVIGFSRAVRDGDRVLVSGTGPVMADGGCPEST